MSLVVLRKFKVPFRQKPNGLFLLGGIIILKTILPTMGCSNGVIFNNSCECQDGWVCVDNRCVKEPECERDADCDGGQCIEGGCYLKECDEGESRRCATDCGEGDEFCVHGVYRGCTAPQPRAEICGDEKDNNCDGRTDEGCGNCMPGEKRECTTECGTGTEWCVDSFYKGCTAAQPFLEVCNDKIDNDCDNITDEDCVGCVEGQRRLCLTECSQGTEHCEQGFYTGCGALQPTKEYCDGKDNDCDGDTDEGLVRECSNACGQGVEICQGGSWVGCTTAQNCICANGQVDHQICGQCGTKERVCSGGVWSSFGNCVEPTGCVPGTVTLEECPRCGWKRQICEENCQLNVGENCLGQGECEESDLDEENCGGTCAQKKTRTCSSECLWGEWSECRVNDVVQCIPPSVDDADCEKCGIKTRNCLPSCTWGTFGLCKDKGTCESSPPQIQKEQRPDCPKCGKRERTCQSDCSWGEWSSSCVESGECEYGESLTERCGECISLGKCGKGICREGKKTRVCDSNCKYGDWSFCSGNVDPSTDYCGDGLDQDCDGQDQGNPDGYEPNNSCLLATDLGTQDPDNLIIEATIDTAADTADYYKFWGVDDFGIGYSEKVKVWLQNIPASSDFDIYLYKGATDCTNNKPIASSTQISNQDEYLEWTEATASSDSDWYFIKIVRIYGNSCYNKYKLTVFGLR